MGILFQTKKDENVEISLTKYSIKHIEFITDTEFFEPFVSDLIREIILKGAINTEKIIEKIGTSGVDEQSDSIEFDSVRKLANWAAIPENFDCYKNVHIEITDSIGELIRAEDYRDMFVVDFTESFSNSKGHGEFSILLREKVFGQ